MVGEEDIEVGYWLLDGMGFWKVLCKNDTTYTLRGLKTFLYFKSTSSSHNIEIQYNRDDDIILGKVDLLDILLGLE